MANKKFRRFITGMLLSCNIASFSFCSAQHDVLTEAISKESGSSEKLKALYNVGRMVQENYAKNQAKIAQANETATTLYNQSIKELDDLQQYYDELFADCCDPDKLKQILNDFVDSIKYDILSYALTVNKDIKDDKFILAYAQLRFLENKKHTFAYLLNSLGYLNFPFICKCKLEKNWASNLSSLFKVKHQLPILIKFSISLEEKKNGLQDLSTIDAKVVPNTWYQYLLRQSQLELTEMPQRKFKEYFASDFYQACLRLRQLANTTKSINHQQAAPYLHEVLSITSAGETDSLLGKAVDAALGKNKSAAKFLKDLPKNLLPYNNQPTPKQNTWLSYTAQLTRQLKRTVDETIKKEKEIILAEDAGKTTRRILHQTILNHANSPLTNRRIIESLGRTARDCLTRRCEKVLVLAIPNTLTLVEDSLKPSGQLTGLQRIYRLPSQIKTNLAISPADEHLKVHFGLAGTVDYTREETKYTGKFGTNGSVFLAATDVNELFNTRLPSNNEKLLAVCRVTDSAGEIFYNYIYFIYDYDKYGFVKTGEVYDSTDNKWKSAYAIMLVTDDTNKLITVYPLYM